ncbi:hypothetical protein IMZ11_02600 [Microtetraspora sp. AC03309]|uniref:hypothetical protein n=1 Tax=Microtetraspora sp. AC03309 TaxID=2779376 RepID=UPI001E5AC051|nr:hypothetical protein [Microtetraspora sp. AC03309]MCC5574529.1 hypothetical protein [Microtetraspora sp. AC03309]
MNALVRAYMSRWFASKAAVATPVVGELPAEVEHGDERGEWACELSLDDLEELRGLIADAVAGERPVREEPSESAAPAETEKPLKTKFADSLDAVIAREERILARLAEASAGRGGSPWEAASRVFGSSGSPGVGPECGSTGSLTVSPVSQTHSRTPEPLNASEAI